MEVEAPAALISHIHKKSLTAFFGDHQMQTDVPDPFRQRC
jgi:hypothetical protein